MSLSAQKRTSLGRYTVGYQYQQFGMLFGVKPTYFQYQIDHIRKDRLSKVRYIGFPKPLPQIATKMLDSKFQVMVKFFFKCDIRLKSGLRHGFRSIISNFSSGTCRTRFLAFSEKSSFLYNFVRKCMWNILGTKGISNRQISKNQFYILLKLVKIDTFSYSSH